MQNSPFVRMGFERPVNPNLLLLHIGRHLTDEMAEKYSRRDLADVPDYIRPYFEYKAVEQVHLMRHRIRFRLPGGERDKLAQFVSDEVVPRTYGTPQWIEIPKTDRRRKYSTGKTMDGKIVVEGLIESQKHPFAARIYAIDGIAELILTNGWVEVKRSPAYPWEEIEGKLLPLLSGSV